LDPVGETLRQPPGGALPENPAASRGPGCRQSRAVASDFGLSRNSQAADSSPSFCRHRKQRSTGREQFTQTMIPQPANFGPIPA